MAGHVVVLFSATGLQLRTTVTDAAGRYEFQGLTGSSYRVAYDDTFWRSMRLDWQPTTTGTLQAAVVVQLPGDTVRDFGWRPIARTTDVWGPIDVYTGPSGLRVETFSDAVEPEAIYGAMMESLVGSEARYITVRFDLNQGAQTAAGWQGSPGSYSNYAAAVYAGYAGWIDAGDQVLAHEYGHAWSYYYDRIIQQESGFQRYFEARGLEGDPRIGSTYRWYPAEMIAEDYRELFGSENAQLAWHLNRDIPAPEDVPGLRQWFVETFMVAPPG